MFKKKLSKIALLAASAAFILVGLPACSGDDDDGDGDEFKADTVLVTAAELGASATSAESSDASVVTAEVSDGGVKLTSKKEGSATVTAKADGYSDAKISVTVGKTGKITKTVTKFVQKTPNSPFEGITVTVVCKDESVKLTEEQLEKVQYLLNSGDETFTAAIEGYYKDADFNDAYETGDDGLPVLGDDDTALYVKVNATKEDFLAAIEDVEVPETPDTFFESFLASDLVKNNADTEITAKDADDGTWSIVPASGKKLKAKPASITTYDNTTYSARLSAESSDVGSIKLKIGAGQTKILRVDAGNEKGDITETGDGTIVVGGTTWAVQLAASTKYFEVTGGDDGYVTIDLKKNKSNIYAITVVDALVDTSKIDRTAEKVTYNAPVITLAEEAKANEELTAEVAKPTKTTTTYTAKADGVAAPTTADNPEELTDITLTYAWSKGGEAISDATGLTYTPTAGGVYTFTASYTAENRTYSASKNVTVMSSTTYTVTFEAGEGSFASGEKTTTFTVHEELTLKEEDPDFKEPKPTAPGDKVFTGWKSSVEGITIDDPITQDVTFTAQYGDKPATVVLGYCNEWGTFDTTTKTPADVKDSEGNTIISFAGTFSGAKAITAVTGQDIDGKSVSYTATCNLGGNTSSRTIKISVPTGKTADIYVAFVAASNDANGRSCAIGSAAGKYDPSKSTTCDIAAAATSTNVDDLKVVQAKAVAGGKDYYITSDTAIAFGAIQVRLN